MFEFLQDLCAAFRLKGMWGNEKQIKLYIACVAEAVAATATMPFWLPVVGAASVVAGAALVVKAQVFADNALVVQPPHGTVLGHGSVGGVTLYKEGATCFALKSTPRNLLQSRNMEKALQVEREALVLCRASPFFVQ